MGRKVDILFIIIALSIFQTQFHQAKLPRKGIHPVKTKKLFDKLDQSFKLRGINAKQL
tara:strand:- start:363 stop:536 length:174 start_codon:yes stop_codon:yes gene_type:complete